MLREKLQSSKWLKISFIGILLGGFIILTSEVSESISGHDELIGSIDEYVLNFMVKNRHPQINGVAIDLTALGSATALTIMTIFLCTFLIQVKKINLALQFFISIAGSSVLTSALKFYFERSRPDKILRLVEVQGFSYPSGHSLSSAAAYFTIGIFASEFIKGTLNRGILWTLTLGLISLIGITRLYLGVHYVSDVLAGILIGIAWASLVEYAMSNLILPRHQ